jgi:TolB-like protein/Tfp pilus assembly protein PilF
MANATQRRLAAIVSADVVGYSRLMGADETGTLAALQARRIEVWDPLIEQYGGRVVGTAGDSILVEYASAVAAVESSIAVQLGMTERNADLPEERRMLLRIGINIGEVIVDGDDIFGDGVNIAARLQAIADSGGIAISSNVHEQVSGKLDVTFLDDGKHEVKNIERPVHIWRWSPEAETPSNDKLADRLLVLPDKPSIAVLPFDNMSGDPEQEYFSDGIAEDIITDLSKFSWLMVVARNSSFSFKGQAMDLREMANELGVRYILEGSVRKSGSRVRITAQLIDAHDGAHIWAERYNRQLEDIFDLQDEMTENITKAIAPELEMVEARRAQTKRPDSLDAWDIVLRAKAHAANMTIDHVVEARQLAERALELQPDYVEALSVVALCYGRETILSYAPGRLEKANKAVQFARQALNENPNDTTALVARSMGEMALGLMDEAVETMRQCVQINPNDHTGHRALAAALCRNGEYKTAIREADIALAFSPGVVNMFAIYSTLAYAYLGIGNVIEAKKWTDKLMQVYPDFPSSHHLPTVVYVELGQIDDAKQAMARFLDSNRGATIKYMREWFTFKDPKLRERYMSALRQVGMPEE